MQDQASELGTEAYYGGAVFPRHASLDPGKYHAGLLGVVAQGTTGMKIISHCRAMEITRNASGFEVSDPKGPHPRQQGHCRHQWLHRRSHAMASPPRHPDRLLCDRHRGDSRPSLDGPSVSNQPHPLRHPQAGLLLPPVARPQTGAVSAAGCRCRKPIRARADRNCATSWSGCFPNWPTPASAIPGPGTVAFSFDTLAHCGEDKGCSTPWAIAARVSGWRAISERAPAGLRQGWMTRQAPSADTKFPDPAVLHRITLVPGPVGGLLPPARPPGDLNRCRRQSCLRLTTASASISTRKSPIRFPRGTSCWRADWW
jgi:hypothetical protein